MERGDKSPHSKRAVIVHLHLTKATSETTPTFNCTRTWIESSPLRRWRDSMDNLKVLEKVAPRHDSATGLVVVLRDSS